MAYGRSLGTTLSRVQLFIVRIHPLYSFDPWDRAGTTRKRYSTYTAPLPLSELSQYPSVLLFLGWGVHSIGGSSTLPWQGRRPVKDPIDRTSDPGETERGGGPLPRPSPTDGLGRMGPIQSNQLELIGKDLFLYKERGYDSTPEEWSAHAEGVTFQSFRKSEVSELLTPAEKRRASCASAQ